MVVLGLATNTVLHQKLEIACGMEKYFLALKRKRLESDDLQPWLRTPKAPQPSILLEDQVNEEADLEEDEEFELLHVDYLEDQPHGQPATSARLLATWGDGSFTSEAICSFGSDASAHIRRKVARLAPLNCFID